jgi:hypothetical protein
MINPLKKKIEKELKIKEYWEHDKQIYFKTLSGSIVYLPRNYYFDRKKNLEEYFLRLYPDDQVKQKRLVLENLGLFAKVIPDKIWHPKYEVVYESNAVTVIKESNYSPEEDFKNMDDKYFKGLRDPRTGELIEEQENPWRTKRNDWILEYALKVRNRLRKLMGSDKNE